MLFRAVFVLFTSALAVSAASDVSVAGPLSTDHGRSVHKRCHAHKHKAKIAHASHNCQNGTAVSPNPSTSPAPSKPAPGISEPVKPAPNKGEPQPSPPTKPQPSEPAPGTTEAQQSPPAKSEPSKPAPGTTEGQQSPPVKSEPGDKKGGTVAQAGVSNTTTTDPSGSGTDTTGWNKATTTLYYDNSGGACGCFDKTTNSMFDWQRGTKGFITAAASSRIYGSSGQKGWCAEGCGKCYKLVSTGEAACPTCGKGTLGLKSEIAVMVTNLCPNSGDLNYCVGPDQTNKQGYKDHFDLMAPNMNIFGKTWDNPVVYYKEIDCPTSLYDQCICKGKETNQMDGAH